MNSIRENGKKGSHFMHADRLILEYYLCGKVERLNSDLTTSFVYNADYAQQDADYQMSAKGRAIKLGRDHTFAREAGRLIKQKRYSPYTVIASFNHSGWPSSTRVCAKTLYTYIRQGLIKNV